jgi:Na+-translocating ferredoxin:NAD+ oxidoreductase RnfD subunit
MNYWRTPKGCLLIGLLVLTAAALLGSDSLSADMAHTAVAVGTALLIDVGCLLLLGYKLRFPDGALLTGLICALVLSGTTSHLITATAASIGILTKHAFTVGRKPLFNPAAFGLWIVLAFPGTMESWWGGLPLLPAWTVLLLLAVGYFVVNRVNKFPLAFTFLLVYVCWFLAIGLLHIGNAAESLRTPFIQSALFLAFFMLTDPPTSPAGTKQQIVFGLIAALISVTICSLHGGLAYLLVGLLAANAWYGWERYRARTHRPAQG